LPEDDNTGTQFERDVEALFALDDEEEEKEEDDKK
jgi:hypothetical protein